jgi:hypothetical protein
VFSVIFYGQNFFSNWVEFFFFNLVYKSDMCLLTCEIHMFFLIVETKLK